VEDTMGEELVLARNRFIMRLLEQNFVRVDGPRFEDGKSIFYEVGTRGRCKHSVRIAFDLAFLSEPDNEFARVTLEALRDAKGLLHEGSRRVEGRSAMPSFAEKVQIGETGYESA
jgi:hypothetical protein